MNIRGMLILTVALPGNAAEGPHRVGPEVIYRCGRLRKGDCNMAYCEVPQ
jgi:hypothetical protein